MYCHALHKKIINAGRILRLSFVKCRVDRLYLCLILYYNSDIFEIAIISTAIFYLGYMQIVALHSMYRHILAIKEETKTNFLWISKMGNVNIFFLFVSHSKYIAVIFAVIIRVIFNA